MPLIWFDRYTLFETSVLDSSVFCIQELTVSSVFRFLVWFAFKNWLFIVVSHFLVVFFFAAVVSFFCMENAPKWFFSIICSRPAPSGNFCTIMKCFCTTCEASYTTVRVAPQADSFCGSWRIGFFLAPKYELLQSNSCLLWCKKVMETRVEFHFSCVYTFSATLSSLRNWANHGRYRLRPSTPAQLCWSSSRLQPLQKI